MRSHTNTCQPIRREWIVAPTGTTAPRTSRATAMRRSIHRTLVLLSVLILAMASSIAGAGTPAYTITNLGHLGGGRSLGASINASGQVVGDSSTSGGNSHAFLYDDGTMFDLGTLGGTDSTAYGINANGQVAGWSFTAGNLAQHAFLWTPTTPNGHTGTMRDLGTLGGAASFAWGLNDAGQVIGASLTAGGVTHGFVYDGTMHDLGTLGGAVSDAIGINTAGQIVGTSRPSSAGFHATLHDGTLHDLGTLGGTNGYAYSINDSGQIAGFSETTPGDPTTHAFLYEDGTMRDIGSLGGTYMYAMEINNGGEIVGSGYTAEGFQHAFVYSSGRGLVDLNSLIDPELGIHLIYGNGINDAGQITGGGSYGYLLTPTPEPGGLTLLVFAAPALLSRRALKGSSC